MAGMCFAAMRWIVLLLLLVPAFVCCRFEFKKTAIFFAVLVLAAGVAANATFVFAAERTGVRWTDHLEEAMIPNAIALVGGWERVLPMALVVLLVATLFVLVLVLVSLRLSAAVSPRSGYALVASWALIVAGSWLLVEPIHLVAARPILLLHGKALLPIPPRAAAAAAYDKHLNADLRAVLKDAALAIEQSEAVLPELIRTPSRLPDIVVILNETFRADVLNPEVMPQLSAAAEAGLPGLEHHSSGNASELGLYGLLRAVVPAHYSTQVSQGYRSSALMRWAQERGYERLWLSGGRTLHFKDLGSIIDGGNFDEVSEALRGPHDFATGDEMVFSKLLTRLQEPRGLRKPIFAFIFGLSLHYPYSFEEGFSTWSPEDLPHWANRFPSGREASLARYANTAHRLDQNLGRFCNGVDLDRTLVVITGDHGESFQEDGLEGHGGSPSTSQLRTPLVVLGAGVQPLVLRSPTSHLDLPATILHAVDGVSAPIGHGRSLLEKAAEGRGVLVVANGQRHPYDLNQKRESSLFCLGASPVRPHLRFRPADAADGRPPQLKVDGWATADGRFHHEVPPPLDREAAKALILHALEPLLQ